jgi:hypothetical protein
MTGGRFADWRSSRWGFVSGLARVRATKEANLPAARQSAIQHSLSLANLLRQQGRPLP